jgi:protein SCO1/2
MKRLGWCVILSSTLAAACGVARPPVNEANEAKGYTDEHGRAVSLEGFLGQAYVVTAIYTSCTERCPLTIDKLRDVEEALRAEGVTAPIVLLTLDPRTDTPERLLRYKESRRLPEHWHLLRGDEAATRALARWIGLRFAGDGAIDHDVVVAVIDRRGRLRRRFEGWSFDVSDVVAAAAEAQLP